MKYFRLQSVFEAGCSMTNERLLDIPMSCEDRWPLDTGELVNDWNPGLFLVTSGDGRVVDFPCVAGSWHIMSERLRCLIDSVARSTIQFLPIRIRSITGQVATEPFSAANYLHIVDALHRECSQVMDDDWSFDEDTRCFSYLEKAVLSLENIREKLIFRVFGQLEVVVFREDVVSAIQHAGIIGCVFSELEIA
ncbi:MAG: imm11 family protein [Planctomycetaceae bacterium]